MEKKKCEICGEMKPLDEFSKSYKHRCKACVAELARNERELHKEKVQRKAKEARLEAMNEDSAAPSMAGSKRRDRLRIATAAMQGFLSNHLWISNLVQTAKEEQQNSGKDGGKWLAATIVRDSLEIADTLLSEIDKVDNHE